MVAFRQQDFLLAHYSVSYLLIYYKTYAVFINRKKNNEVIAITETFWQVAFTVVLNSRGELHQALPPRISACSGQGVGKAASRSPTRKSLLGLFSCFKGKTSLHLCTGLFQFTCVTAARTSGRPGRLRSRLLCGHAVIKEKRQ